MKQIVDFVKLLTADECRPMSAAKLAMGGKHLDSGPSTIHPNNGELPP
ncbi:hypothetical protein [Roseateles sp.]|nr:hypothetical protein [Roseateles sp.]